jgi:hypothetical protein
MSKLLWVVIAVILVALGVGGFVVLSGDDDPDGDDVAANAEGSTTSSSLSSGNDGFCQKFATLASAQSAAASRMMGIFRDLTTDGSNPDATKIAADLRAFIARIEAAAALRVEAPSEIASDYEVVEAGLVGATVPYGKLASAAEQSLEAARAYANGSFMDDVGDIATDQYIDAGEKVEAWVETNCPRS